MIKTRKIRKDTLPEGIKLVITLTDAHERFKMKLRQYKSTDTPDELKRHAGEFIDAVLTGDTDKLKQDESISHRVLNHKVYLKDNY